ncbi:MAG: IclR family transcriptional regulator [Synergistaceae bacterium]|nr:IclR family transcriptional regulator [Synergistaceae bacterium]
MPVNSKEQSSQSTEKLFAILEYLTNSRLPVRLQDVSESLGIPQSTLLRYFSTLIKENYVYQDEDTKRYAMTWKICRFGYMLRSNLGIRSIIGPYLNLLANKLGLNSCAVILDGYESIYIDLVEDPSGMTNTLLRIGKRAPLHSTGSGKVMLSTFSDYDLEKYIKERGLLKLTENTITDETQLREQLKEIRTRRYATDNEECEQGLRCISVPVFDYTNGVIAAVSMFGNVSKTDDEFMTGKVLYELLQVSRVLSFKFGCGAEVWENFEMPANGECVTGPGNLGGGAL